MKNIILNLDNAQEVVNLVEDFDSVSMLSIICVLIDAYSAKYDEDPKEVADIVRDMVYEVNDTFGRYEI